MDLEGAFNQLRHLTETLEAGSLTLEESLKVHAEATELQLRIKAELAKAERFVVEVIDQDGNVTPFGVVGERK